MSTGIGQPLARVDGPAKVTGAARYAAEFTAPGMAHAALVTSATSRGRILGFDFSEAERVPGVLGFLTHQNAPRLGKLHGPMLDLSSLTITLQDDRIHYDRQALAVAIAETPEAAVRAAELVRVHTEALPPRVSMLDWQDHAFNPGNFLGSPVNQFRGDFDAGWAESDVRVSATYTTPQENHNPLEPHATLAWWEGDRLEVHDSSQFVEGVRTRLANLLGLDEANVRVICPYVGGGFGSKGQTWPVTLLAVMAARLVERPVRLALTRDQLFGVVGHRSPTHQHVRLGASRDGRLVAYGHDTLSQCAFFSEYVEPVSRSVGVLYACPNVAIRQRVVRLDTNNATFMRAPGDATGLFALESALDELAYALGIDPVTLRLRNDTPVEPTTGRPWSSKSLVVCYERAADRFGWNERPVGPRMRREGHDWVGWGMASATLHSSRSPATVRVRLRADGSVAVECATHELGTGIATLMTQVASDVLGVSATRSAVRLGDTALPYAPLSAGSQTTASVTPAVKSAAEAVRESLLAMAREDRRSPLAGLDPDAIGLADGRLFALGEPERGEAISDLLQRRSVPELAAERHLDVEDEDRLPKAMRAFGCHFVEVRVDADLGTIRVARYVGAFGAGRILNPRTARAQLAGAAVWGIGMALMEETTRDPRNGRVLNANLADYLIPVNADVPELEVLLVDEDDDQINSLGAKGLGELGISGLAAAIANAVFHATGERLRDLPLTPDKLVSRWNPGP
ncbi:MAG TPA: xanthine dehydrogenase family protein molybdopterin-binding subunit [Oscillatoriaceae cyanobacterium]